MLLKEEGVKVEWIDADSEYIESIVNQIFEYYSHKFPGYVNREDYKFYSYHPDLVFEFADNVYAYEKVGFLQSFIDGYLHAVYKGLKKND